MVKEIHVTSGRNSTTEEAGAAGSMSATADCVNYSQINNTVLYFCWPSNQLCAADGLRKSHDAGRERQFRPNRTGNVYFGLNSARRMGLAVHGSVVPIRGKEDSRSRCECIRP